jgi:cytochrome P450
MCGYPEVLTWVFRSSQTMSNTFSFALAKLAANKKQRNAAALWM